MDVYTGCIAVVDLAAAPARGANAFAEAGGVGDTCRVKLVDYLDSFQQVLDHPRHRAGQDSLVELIRQLRACTNVYEGYEFQQALLSHVLAVEEDRNAFSRAVKRMADGKAPQSGAPEPQSGLIHHCRRPGSLNSTSASGSRVSSAVSATRWPGGCSACLRQ